VLLETGVLFNAIFDGSRPGRSHLGLAAKGTPPNHVDGSLTSIVTVLPLSSVSYFLGTGGDYRVSTRAGAPLRILEQTQRTRQVAREAVIGRSHRGVRQNHIFGHGNQGQNSIFPLRMSLQPQYTWISPYLPIPKKRQVHKDLNKKDLSEDIGCRTFSMTELGVREKGLTASSTASLFSFRCESHSEG